MLFNRTKKNWNQSPERPLYREEVAANWPAGHLLLPSARFQDSEQSAIKFGLEKVIYYLFP